MMDKVLFYRKRISEKQVNEAKETDHFQKQNTQKEINNAKYTKETMYK